MNTTFRTIFIALISGMSISLFFTTLSAKATPQETINHLAQRTSPSQENSRSALATNIKKTPATLDIPTLKLCNFTPDAVNYSINGSNSNLKSSTCVTWKLNNVALLSFDKLFLAGYQKQTYELSAGQYIFQGHHWGAKGSSNNGNDTNGLNLFKFESASSS